VRKLESKQKVLGTLAGNNKHCRRGREKLNT
jgi:hypothetical protein